MSHALVPSLFKAFTLCAVVLNLGTSQVAAPRSIVHGAAQVRNIAKLPAAKPITKLLISKSAHSLEALAADGSIVASYRVAIGPGGAGYKQQEGDLVTPVGSYHIVLHAQTRWHEFMLIDYPNAADRVRFAELKRSGLLPREATIGGNVGIHGSPTQLESKATHKQYDWTLGCVALDDDEIKDLAGKVRDGTAVEIVD
jgi:murein L,D-transpeptidase YafK